LSVTCADFFFWEQSVENIWPNKIEYSISTPTKAVIFGTSIRVDFKLIPLLKGLGIGQIVSQLIETHDLTLNPEDPDAVRNTYKNTRTIVNDEHTIDADQNLEIIDEAAEGYQFSRLLDLPKTLARCLQDTDTRGIKVRHKLKFRVQLLNPDGHISEVRRAPFLDYWKYLTILIATSHSTRLYFHLPELGDRRQQHTRRCNSAGDTGRDQRHCAAGSASVWGTSV
jgi:hypothetical protein